MRVWPQRAADRAFIFITVYAATSSRAVTGGAWPGRLAVGEGRLQICRLGDERPPDQEIKISENNEIKMGAPRLRRGHFRRS